MRLRIAAVGLLLLALAVAPPTFVAHSAAAPAQPATATSGPRLALPVIHDDYARAVAEARARKVPLFIEAWAPW